jgi:5'-3' exonuclease
MGITNIKNILNQSKNGITNSNISNYSNKKIAIDFNNYIYKFLYRNKINYKNQYNYLIYLLEFIFFLRKYNIIPIFVIDGNVPKEKNNTINKRIENKNIIENKINSLSNDVCNLIINKNNNLNLDDNNNYLINNNNQIINFTTLLNIDTNNINTNNQSINIDNNDILLDNNIINKLSEIYTLNNRCIYFTKEHKKLCLALFRYLGIPYILSPWEADDMCGYLYKNGYIDACISEDTDFLAHGIEILLRNINTYTGDLKEYKLSHICKDLDINFEQFLDICILCGTDYYKIKGIGPKNAYKLIYKYKSIEKSIDYIIDNKSFKLNEQNKNDFNYKEIRLMFNKYMNNKQYSNYSNYNFQLGQLRWDKCKQLLHLIGYDKFDKQFIINSLNIQD